MNDHYGSSYHRLIRKSGEVDLIARWRQPRERLFQLSKGGTLLDIGCSSGSFLRTIKEGPWRLHGIEISPQEAREAERTSGAQVFVGDVLNARYTNESFDVITCFHVLEHMYKPAEIIGRVWQLLKPGGVFYMLSPNIDAVERYVFGSYWYGLELPRHLYHFSPTSLRSLFASGAFDEVILQTNTDCYVERSIYYLVRDVLITCGFSRPALCDANGVDHIPWKVVRKALRLGVLWPFRKLCAAVGHGSAIEAAFRKRDTRHP